MDDFIKFCFCSAIVIAGVSIVTVCGAMFYRKKKKFASFVTVKRQEELRYISLLDFFQTKRIQETISKNKYRLCILRKRVVVDGQAMFYVWAEFFDSASRKSISIPNTFETLALRLDDEILRKFGSSDVFYMREDFF